MSVVGGSLVALLQDLNTPPECLPPLQLELERLENEARSLRCNLEAVLSAMNESQRDRLSSPRATTGTFKFKSLPPCLDVRIFMPFSTGKRLEFLLSNYNLADLCEGFVNCL